MRSKIYKSYKGFKNLETKKGELLKQQVFLSTYINDSYDKIDRMLLFHGIGTGKTCTSITIAETIMKKNSKMKVLVILPARLKTNFIDELISETCNLNKYITKTEFDIYTNQDSAKKDKKKIMKSFLSRINENYDIRSYENFRKTLLDSTNLKATIKNLTENKIIIIDEIHNLITSKIKPDILKTIITSNKIPKKTQKINGVILRLLTKLAHPSSRIFLLTATPVFDNYGQFIELILNLRPDVDETKITRSISKIGEYINLLKGRVSFYKLKDRSDFPKVKTENHSIVMSKTQQALIEELKGEEIKEESILEELSNMFCVTERQLSISVYSKDKKEKVFSNLHEYAPKLELLFNLLKAPGKHLIFSNFIQYCLYLIASYLEKNGWSNYLKTGITTNKTFVIWDASLKDEDKQTVKMILNSKENMDGSKIKVILGSPSIKEGISFKHVQHLHQIDPVWNSSAKDQIEGRCIRFKSHEDIPLSHKTLKREVVIHNYILVAPEGVELETCDEKIYNTIIKNKAELIKIIDNLLAKIAIDYYLWTDDTSPLTHSKSSIITAEEEKRKLSELAKKFKIRGNDKQKKAKSSCNPPSRRPVDGNCSDPFPFLRKTKKGDECCYKKQGKKDEPKEKKSKSKSPKEDEPKKDEPKEKKPRGRPPKEKKPKEDKPKEKKAKVPKTAKEEEVINKGSLGDYKNLYEILEVSKTATEEEIKTAYKKLALKYHPDKTKGDVEGERRFKSINQAKQILTEPKRRKYYDLMMQTKRKLPVIMAEMNRLIQQGRF
jgi:DnaJ-domain-containing protein 1